MLAVLPVWHIVAQRIITGLLAQFSQSQQTWAALEIPLGMAKLTPGPLVFVS